MSMEQLEFLNASVWNVVVIKLQIRSRPVKLSPPLSCIVYSETSHSEHSWLVNTPL